MCLTSPNQVPLENPMPPYQRVPFKEWKEKKTQTKIILNILIRQYTLHTHTHTQIYILQILL